MTMISDTGASPLRTDAAPVSSSTVSFNTYDGKQEVARFFLKGEAAGLRSYQQSSTLTMRDAVPSTIAFSEVAGMPVVRSGSLAFDALFAHAVVEMKANSVGSIHDGAYNDGKPIACDCFETGEKWTYVWTRDLSYAADLGLALLDPRRVRNSLEFKLSAYRPGAGSAPGVPHRAGGLQIIQDTGSGGSWPVSTDRVSWAFGASQALNALAPAERAAFAVTALQALSNTIEGDRVAAYDPRDGLYTGEQSFLDWREQSYGAGIADDLARMASAKALSTNVAHYQALSLAARLAAEQDNGALAARYSGFASALKAAINQQFWLEDAGLYSSLSAAYFDGAPLRKFDWLGQSLAIVTGVADAGRTARILASYPHGPIGAPVIFPQQPGVPVYHNRAIWPFVTAYGLKAAVIGANVSVADAAYASLVRGASLHMSNMENMEWLSGQARFEDPARPELGGPVINSRRQLWSVGAYLGMVIHNVFGVALDQHGLTVNPFITARLRREQFGASPLLRLESLRLGDKLVSVRIALPAATEAEGYYPVTSVSLNGQGVGHAIKWADLQSHNVIEIGLGPLKVGDQRITRVVEQPTRHAGGATFAPYDPVLARAVRTATGQVEVLIDDAANEAGSVKYALYRNGKLLGEHAATGVWADPAPLARANCYAVEAVSVKSGLRSHHSAPVCAESGLEIAVDDHRVRSSVALSSSAGRPASMQNWGAPADTFSVQQVVLRHAGRYAFQLRYKNTSNAINTGVTNGVKMLTVCDGAGQVIALRVVQMPHLPAASAPMWSTPADITLGAGTYSVELSDYFNMSYLASNALYGEGGGKAGLLNRVDLYGLRILQLE
jgi:hypothetical protein